jgi:hypothetical protein
LFQAQARIKANKAVEELVKMLAASGAKVRAAGVVQAMGLDDRRVADKLVEAMAYVEFGVVSVKLSQEDCVKLARVKPACLLDLYDRIEKLSGLGFVAQGELNATGTTPE